MKKEIVENLILQSLQETSQLIIDGTSRTHIIMPHYRAKINKEITIRYSEQELKQVFLASLSGNQDLYYSVETPSKYIYSFKGTKAPKIEKLEKDADHFESARFDVSLYDSNNVEDLCCHIEFKHENPQNFNISKDLLKLSHEIIECKYKKNFFVHYIVRESKLWKSKSLPSVIKKYRKAINLKNMNLENLSSVWVYLMFVNIGDEKETFVYKFNLKNLDDLTLEPTNESIKAWIGNKEIWKNQKYLKN